MTNLVMHTVLMVLILMEQDAKDPTKRGKAGEVRWGITPDVIAEYSKAVEPVSVGDVIRDRDVAVRVTYWYLVKHSGQRARPIQYFRLWRFGQYAMTRTEESSSYLKTAMEHYRKLTATEVKP